MSRLRTMMATAVAVLFAAAACQDSAVVLEPDTPRVSAVPLSSCDVLVTDDEPTVQDGVDAASSGETVCVDGGRHTEQVVINKDLVLQGINGPTIEASSDPGDFTIPESGSTWEPVVFAFGGTESGGAVSGSGTVEVTIQGFTVDGAGRQPNTDRSVGIFYRNVEGTVGDNTVVDMGVGGKETFGILAYGASDVKIRDNTVSEYERGGIGVNGDGGAHPSPVAEVSGNDVTGTTGIEEAWAPNGIQVGFGATGRITDNVVVDNRWSPEEDGEWAASCIIVFESDGVRVKENNVQNCDAGITTGSWAWINPPSADNTKIQKNEVTNAFVGILLQPVAWEGVSSTDPSVSNSKVDQNDLEGGLGDESIGIAIDAIDSDPTFDPIAENNKLIRNSISGFDDAIDDEGSNSKSQVNVIEG